MRLQRGESIRGNCSILSKGAATRSVIFPTIAHLQASDEIITDKLFFAVFCKSLNKESLLSHESISRRVDPVEN